jgi:hypothetical protein
MAGGIMEPRERLEFDVVIVGYGPVGATAAMYASSGEHLFGPTRSGGPPGPHLVDGRGQSILTIAISAATVSSCVAIACGDVNPCRKSIAGLLWAAPAASR